MAMNGGDRVRLCMEDMLASDGDPGSVRDASDDSGSGVDSGVQGNNRPSSAQGSSDGSQAQAFDSNNDAANIKETSPSSSQSGNGYAPLGSKPEPLTKSEIQLIDETIADLLCATEAQTVADVKHNLSLKAIIMICERVLWVAVESLLEMNPFIRTRIIARDSLRGEDMQVLAKARDRFGVKLDSSRIEFVFVKSAKLLSGEAWPKLTLLGQSLGAVIVGAEALWRAKFPLVFLDTVGAAFTYPLAWLVGTTVCTYTHYPTISTDMLARVHERRPAYNNDKLVAGSLGVSRAKYAYYLGFCILYRVVGQFATVVMVNSNWTRAHIEQLWLKTAVVVFPPCDIKQFSEARLPLAEKRREIVSLGQFRPEKDHRLQMQALAVLKERFQDTKRDIPRLVMYGGCRNEEDERRIADLKAYAAKLGVDDLVAFKVNVPFEELKKRMGGALLGVHTMWNEHFGIAPVEMMAAGIILVAHNSGGPKIDIIQQGITGFLADSAQAYAECFENVLTLFDEAKLDKQGRRQSEELNKIVDNAAGSILRFSQELFDERFKEAMLPALTF